MAPWMERVKTKFGRKKPPTSTLGEALSTPHAPAIPNPTAPLPSLPEQLWNHAYDQVKRIDSTTVDTYERILSARLSQKDADPADFSRSPDLASQQNAIEQDPNKRWKQMCQLVQDGLRRTEKDTSVKQGMEDGIQAAMAVKEVVDRAVQAAPEAALAWVGVCFALEILMNPLTQASSNRQGIAYVVSRMDWYWNLSSLLLDENMTEAHSQGLRGELEKIITQLYTKLLLYQMKSVCYYHRGRLSVFTRDLVKLDNWDGELSEIQAAEAAVQSDSAQYNTLSIRTRLGYIAETAQSQNAKLDSINSAIREQTRRQERMHETGADNECLKDLCSTNPRHDKARIEDSKGGLLQDSYLWILENPDFRQWRNDPQNRLLWIKANPGKGKTMLLCGIINELRKSVAQTDLLSYFFCQATDSRINNATAVLRGLVYMLIDQQPSLISHIRKKYDHAGKTLFEDANAWVALTEIFADILQDPSLRSTYLVIDALDECITGLPKLLEFIIQRSSISSRVKWIVSSRNLPDIEERLERVGHKVKLSLELNAKSVSAAVSRFIRHKVRRLAEQKKYDDKTRDAVLDHLSLNANDTFLWVALVCQNLEKIPRWNVLARLNTFPPGLDSLYERMMQQISKSDDPDRCKRILASIAIVYRPITLKELTSLVSMLENMSDDLDSLRDVVGLCGSFLSIQGDTVYFVHQSAKDFLFTKAVSEIFPYGTEETHYALFSRSLEVMSKTLRRDMYNLRALGCSAKQVEESDLDTLATSRYSCIYWIDHLCDWSLSSSATSSVELQDEGAVHEFVRKKYLYWLEALSLCKSMSKGVVSMAKLEALINGRADAAKLADLVRDAHRFIMAHKWAIENSPLQVYVSALVFSPARSLIRYLFKKEEPKWIRIKPAMGDTWSACLRTFEGHNDLVSAVIFSHDSTRLASASMDSTVKIWDTSSGNCLQTLEGRGGWVKSIAFSPDSARLVSASEDKTVRIWDVSNSNCLQTLNGHKDGVMSVAFSPNSARLASGSLDKTIKIWDANTGEYLQTLEGNSDIDSLAFSPDSTQLASALIDSTVKIWDVSSGECLRTLRAESGSVRSVVWSPDSTLLASSLNSTVKIWDASSGECLHTLKGHHNMITSIAFSVDSARLVSGSFDSTIKFWDISNGECLQTLEGHGGGVCSVVFSPVSAQLASASLDSTIKIWDVSTSERLRRSKGHSSVVTSVAFSHDSAWLASASEDKTVKIWDVSSGECLQTLKGHSDTISSAKFSHDSTRLASTSCDNTVKLWDTSSGACLQTLEGHSDTISSATFSHDSTRLASASCDNTVKLWDTSGGACLQTLEGHSSVVTSVAFSHDSAWLALAEDKTVKIWDISSTKCLQTLKGHSDTISSVAFSHDSARLASASEDKTVKIWDASSGECLQTFGIGHTFFNISFDAAGSYLHTEIGTLVIDAFDVSSSSIRIRSGIDCQEPRYQGVSLSSDGAWVKHNSKRLVWLPSEYRPWRVAVSGKTIGMGNGSGKVWICNVELDQSQELIEFG